MIQLIDSFDRAMHECTREKTFLLTNGTLFSSAIL